jgi:SNF family Na+-dependent transporter
MGSIHVYASYLSEKDDVALSGLSTAATNETAEVVMGGTIAIPAAVAFFGVAATMQLAAGGAFNLGFVTLPVIFQQLPHGDLLGALWFFLLFIAGITSSLAMGQVVVAFLEDEFDLGRSRAVTLLGAVLFVAPSLSSCSSNTFMDELDFLGGDVRPVRLRRDRADPVRVGLRNRSRVGRDPEGRRHPPAPDLPLPAGVDRPS